MVDILTFLAGSSVLAFLLIQYLKRYIQDVIGPKYGDLGVQTFLLLVSMVLAIIGSVANLIPAEFLVPIAVTFMGANAIYAVLYKALYVKAIKGRVVKPQTK